MTLPHPLLGRACLGLLLLLGAGSAPAQTWLTSPTSLGGARGDSANAIANPWSAPEARFQLIDRSVRGNPGVIEQLQLRRDETASADALARTCDLTLRMAHCNLDQAGTSFEANNLTPWVTVFQGNVTLPSTSTASTGWTRLTLPRFQTPFAYDGRNDLLVEFICRNTSETSAYPLDATDGRLPGVGEVNYPVPDASCSHAGGAFHIYARPPTTNANRSVRIETYAASGSSAAASALLWGLPGRGSPVPGVCGELQVLPILLGTPAASDSLGRIGKPSQPLSFRFPANRNADLAIQWVSLAPASSPHDLLLSDPALLRIQRQDAGNPVKMVWTHASADAPLGEVTDQQVPVYRLSIR